MSRDFNAWLSNFKSSIASYSFYVDFKKVYRNLDKIKVELNILNSLIGEKDVETKFRELICRYPEVLKCIPILIAVRDMEIEVVANDSKNHIYSFKKQNHSIDEYCEFMRETGLFDLLEHHIINNLVDYVCGVETGLDSNGRKNRGGHLMEDAVEKYILKAGMIKNKTYFKEMKNVEVEKHFGVDLTELTNNGKTVKRFDYVVYAKSKIFLIETNFYSSQGSKLNETARSYKTLALEARNTPQIEFIWITDGKGWETARNNLQETFEIMDHIYSLEDLENGVLDRLFR